MHLQLQGRLMSEPTGLLSKLASPIFASSRVYARRQRVLGVVQCKQELQKRDHGLNSASDGAGWGGPERDVGINKRPEAGWATR